jgi:hypothetical protein
MEPPWTNKPSDFMQFMTQYSLYYSYLGSGVFIASFIQVIIFYSVLSLDSCGLCPMRFWLSRFILLYVEADQVFWHILHSSFLG